MLIIDITWDTMKKMKIGDMQAKYFYLERKKTIEIFTQMSGLLYRTIYPKTNDTEDKLFMVTELGNSTPIINISHANEGEWRAVINSMSRRLANMESIMEAEK